MLETITKLGPVLALFTPSRPRWSAQAIARELNTSVSTTHRQLHSLEEVRLLERRGRSCYVLGQRILEMDDVLWSPDDLRANARQSLTSLAAVCGETTHLAVLDSGTALCLDAVEGSHTLRVSGARIGTRLPAGLCVIGKVLLAHHQGGDPISALATTPSDEDHDEHAADPDSEFATIRSEGLAYDHCSHTSEVHCVAAPIRDRAGFVVAAISLSAPTARFTTAQLTYRRAVREAAASVTSALAVARTRRPSST